MIPYRQPNQQMDYAKLMQLLQMKQMMDAAQQGQQQPSQAPQKSGLSDLLSSFGGGAAGSSVMGNAGAGAVPTTQLADILSMGQAMPSVGPTVGNAAAIPAADTLGLSGMGAGPGALGAVGAGIFASNIYEGGGKDIIRGKGKSDDYANLMLDINPVTAPINMGLRALGMRSVGRQMKTGKSDDQLGRDAGRRALQSSGFADDKFETILADGSKFNLGLDGGTKYKNMGQNIDGKTERNAYDVDFSNPLAKNMIGRVDPYVRKMLGEGASAKQVSDLTGQLINGITSNASDQQGVDRNFDSVFNGKRSATPATPSQVKGPAALPTMQDLNNLVPIRKDSPGFKDGKRIDYSRR